MVSYFKAPAKINDLILSLCEEYHLHLETARIAVQLVESKPYIKDKLNLGKVQKFSKTSKFWMPDGYKVDFCLTICETVWYNILNEDNHRAYADLLLSRCKVDYVPETVEVNGKQKKVVDEYGRISYSNQVKVDDDGSPCWRVIQLDASVFTENIRRFGTWYEDLENLKFAFAKFDNE